ncbi:InlB B-repeat-containing protein, partial [Listeria seeligeri]|uniref:InlB B-repeat-containing protein n=3 Tax=Listeria seeligeri TaxID=1640 RepID=UPI0022EA3A14
MEKKHELFKLIQNIMGLILVVGIGIWAGTSNEMEVQADTIEQPAPINQIFPDSQLADAVKNSLGKSEVTEVVSQTDLNTVQYLLPMGVESIEGIQYLNNLITFEAFQCPIKNLDLLKRVSSLKYLNLQMCDLSDLSFAADLVNLVDLSVAENHISDLSPIANLTNLTSMSIDRQTINSEPVFYQENLVFPNIIKNVDETLIPPTSISNNGMYTNSNISWDLPTYTNSVNYTFSQKITIGSATGSFDGTVVQPLKLGYDATFDIDGTQNSELVEVDTLIAEPQNPSKEGYTFTGWYDEKTGGNKWDFSTNMMPANDITLYAQFSINSYNARLDIDGKTTTQSVVYQEHLVEPTAPTKEGYTFTGWYDEKTGGNKWDFSTNTMPANDITLYAQFSINSYNARLDIDGKTTTQSVVYQEHLAEPTAPTKEGYTFTGWYDEKTGGNKWDFSTNTMPANDITLYAQF